MTKQELYDLAITKFDKVQPINEWSARPAILGVNRYDAVVQLSNGSFKTYTIHVDNDGDPVNESAYIPGNPLADPPAPVESFDQKVDTFIAARKADNTIVDAITDLQGTNVRESYVYRIVNSVLTRERYLLNLDSNGDVAFQKIG